MKPMNKLQIIAEIFGDKFCPVATFSYVNSYAAVLRDKETYSAWFNSHDLQRLITKAEKMGACIGVDLGRQQFDIYFND